MVARHRREVGREAPRRLQSPAELDDHLGPDRIVADEADPALTLGPGRRLADVVEQRREAEGVAAGQLVSERLGEQPGDLAGRIAAELRQGPLDLEAATQDLEGVVVGVEVVVGALADAAERLELGKQRRR